VLIALALRSCSSRFHLALASHAQYSSTVDDVNHISGNEYSGDLRVTASGGSSLPKVNKAQRRGRHVRWAYAGLTYRRGACQSTSLALSSPIWQFHTYAWNPPYVAYLPILGDRNISCHPLISDFFKQNSPCSATSLLL
jgi:hypothetical protein